MNCKSPLPAKLNRLLPILLSIILPIVLLFSAQGKAVEVVSPDKCSLLLSTKTLTTQEIAAIRAITDLDKYWHINKSLRSAWRRYLPNKVIKFLDEALLKLPAYRGTVFRGANLSPDIYQKFAVGKTIKEPAYTSSSTTVETAKFFTTPLNDLSSIKNVIFVIESENGRDVTQYSTYQGQELEILFPRNTRFLITRMEFDTYHYIYMKDLGTK